MIIMKLRGIDFGNVLGASGVQGFFGEGYPFHHFPLVGPNFKGMTFVSKTCTLLKNKGHMPLRNDFTPKEWFPKCIKVNFLKGLAVNSVGLSNPGICTLFRKKIWQKLDKPFFISITSLAETAKDRINEFSIIRDAIGMNMRDFTSPFGIQVNLSCPNTGHDSSRMIAESVSVLEILGRLGVPLMPKYSIESAPFGAMMELNENPDCDAICVSNTVPFGWDKIDFKEAWGSYESPLAHLGGGGLSGKALKPLVLEYILKLRSLGFEKPINGGGGILCKKNVLDYCKAGAASVFLGSVAFLRPWRVKGIIEYADSLKWQYC